MEIKMATSADLPKISEFCRYQLKSRGLPDSEVMIRSWNEPWREESLEHYLGTGWCFAALQNLELTGFVLCQPLLFFQSWTQSLWVEYVDGNDDSIKKALLDVAWRWAKSKHLQRVFFNQDFIDVNLLKGEFSQLAPANHLQVPATKTHS